ncbi:TetR/AcrR family transcriptional regulator [Chitinophaga tropicalis]|uniref:TetR family transcriptional regulator n=1 Tax=Chitinophaga tropicalis TaxID=2683588 RepID=A0A7K1UA90_9BACT|nr:TetR/AcrR family transcriptional regulator [Chitinophaga tropicalis]MVT11282.1 TetR family transcriptional regulator [Chitinophaga tropicalis]
MGITDRKEREKQEMRKLIIDAAMEMFIEVGYDKTSIRSIADKIEYSPATIYLYYKDKDELLYEVQGEAFDRLHKHFLKEVTAADPLERLEQLLAAYMTFGLKHPDLYDLMFILRSPMKAVEEEEAWPNCDKEYNFLIDIVKGCIDKLRFTDPMIAATTIWSLGHGIISLYIRGRYKVSKLPDEQIKEMMWQTAKAHIELIKR